jgi:hypothetical protein
VRKRKKREGREKLGHCYDIGQLERKGRLGWVGLRRKREEGKI